MSDSAQPTFGNGKICYLEIPSQDVPQSAAFYEKVFGWRVRTRSDGSVAFDDGVGEVSGTWVTNRKPEKNPGVLIHIMVDDIVGTSKAVVVAGGLIVQAVDLEAKEWVAHFSDPAGNIFGLYQHGR